MRHRKAFTLIEILISVMLISLVILGLTKIREQDTVLAQYIATRMRSELSNSLFLTRDALHNSGEEKDAYALLRRFHIRKSRTRGILRRQKRKILVSTPVLLPQLPIPLRLITVTLRGDFSSRYYRLIF